MSTFVCYLNRIGISIFSSCSGKPDGLSFSKTSVPRSVSGTGNVSITENGTNSVVIHSPCAWAGTTVIFFPLPSRRCIGNDASKYQNPRASPCISIGLFISSPGSGENTLILSVITGCGAISAGACFCHGKIKHQSSSQKNVTKPVHAIRRAAMIAIIIRAVFIYIME